MTHSARQNDPSMKVVNELHPQDAGRLMQMHRALAESRSRNSAMSLLNIHSKNEEISGAGANDGGSIAVVDEPPQIQLQSHFSYPMMSCELNIRNSMKSLSDPLLNAKAQESGTHIFEDRLHRDDLMRAISHGSGNVSHNARFDDHFSNRNNLKNAVIRVNMLPNRISSGAILRRDEGNVNVRKRSLKRSVDSKLGDEGENHRYSDFFIDPAMLNESDEEDKNFSAINFPIIDKATEEKKIPSWNLNERTSQQHDSTYVKALPPNIEISTKPTSEVSKRIKHQEPRPCSVRTLLPNTNNYFLNPIMEHQQCYSKDSAALNKQEDLIDPNESCAQNICNYLESEVFHHEDKSITKSTRETPKYDEDVSKSDTIK